MQSAIGEQFKSPRAQRCAVVLGVATVALDFAFSTRYEYSDARFALALTIFALIVCFVDGDLRTLGLRSRPRQGWGPWVRISAAIGLSVFVCFVIGLGIWRITGHEIPIYSTPPTQIILRFSQMCFVYPVLEEAIYRVILCVSLVSVLGCWKTITASGLLFGALHIVYGNPSPENLVGGFFLAWVYLKSETILLPVILHSVGNLLALIGQTVGWYLLNTG